MLITGIKKLYVAMKSGVDIPQKVTDLNYLDKDTVRKVKAGQIQSLDGIKLDAPVEFYQKKENYIVDIHHTSEVFLTESNSATNNSGMIDFYSVSDQPRVTRLIDKTFLDKNHQKLSRKKLLKRYGKPKKEDTIFIEYNGCKAAIDFYTHATFFYKYINTSNDYMLYYVIFPGQEIKANYIKWKKIVETASRKDVFDAVLFPISKIQWENIKI